MAEGRTLLITGGTGFLGRHLAVRAKAAGWRVTIASRHPPSDGSAHRRYELGEAIAPSLLEGMTDVVHAAYVPTARHTDALSLNVRATEALLAAAAKAGVRRCLFVSSFSAAVDAPAPYGQQKFACEQRFLEAGQAVVRLGLVLGPGGLAQTLARQLRRWRAVPLLQGGHQALQTVHVDDATLGLLRALDHALPGPWNLAEATPVTYRAWCDATARTLGVRVRYVPVPFSLTLGALRAVERVTGYRPALTDSLLGFMAQRPWPTTTSAEALGLRVRTCDETLASLGVSGLVGA